MRTSQTGLVIACLAIGLLFAGCGGDGNGPINIPAEFVGLWGAVAFDDGGNPTGAYMIEVQDDGDIAVPGVALNAVLPAQAPGDVIGHVVNSGGTFNVTMDDDGQTVSATGDLDTDDTGEGAWIRGFDRGTVKLWRANGNGALTLNLTVAGPATGNGTINVDAAGIITGTATVNGITHDVRGVLTGDGHIAAAWGESGGSFALIEGNVTGTGANGVWTLDDGTNGTWTATFG